VHLYYLKVSFHNPGLFAKVYHLVAISIR